MRILKQRKEMLLFIALLMLQCVYMIFWGTQKSGYYVDEFFTYDNAHYISESTPDRVKLYDADYLEYNKWFELSELKSTLTVQREESLWQDSISHNIKAFTKIWPYMAILNYVEAIFFEGEMNWWSAISLNIILFSLNQILLLLIAKKIYKNQKMSLLAVAMYGFCGMAASMVVYVRFYVYVTFLMTLFTYLHVIMWEGKIHWKNIVMEIFSLLILYIAYRTSPVAGMFGIAIIVCFSIGLLLSKRWKQALYYILPIGSGGILYFALFTHYFEIVLHPKAALNSSNLGAAESGLISDLATLNIEEFIRRMVGFLQIINRYLFGNSLILLLYILLIIVMLVCLMKNIEKHSKENEFIYILLGALITYAIISICFGLSMIRYNSFIFPVIAICCVGIIDLLVCKNQKIVSLLVVGLIIGEIYITVSIPRVDNLYLEDREGVNSIKQHKGINSVVVDYHFDDDVMYECLAYADEKTKVMFTSYGNTDYDKLGDEVLVWRSVNKSDQVVQDLLDAGYTYIDEIARTHVSVVYLCKNTQSN